MAGIKPTLLKEFFTDETTPTLADLPRSTRITDVGTLERYLQQTVCFTSGVVLRGPEGSCPPAAAPSQKSGPLVAPKCSNFGPILHRF